jgi:hypothetical protein
MLNRLAKDWVLIDKTKVYVNAAGSGADARHLNATKKPDDPNSATNFTYLTTDGSSNAPYTKSN